MLSNSFLSTINVILTPFKPLDTNIGLYDDAFDNTLLEISLFLNPHPTMLTAPTSDSSIFLIKPDNWLSLSTNFSDPSDQLQIV